MKPNKPWIKKVLVDCHARIDLPTGWSITVEAQAKYMESEAKDLEEFIRDHRSRDKYSIEIVREFEKECIYCGREPEEDVEGIPVCCDKAMEAHAVWLKHETPNCYQCFHRHPLVGDAHSSCDSVSALVQGSDHGKSHGWFAWPINFDPIWLEECDSFEPIKSKVEETA